MSALSHPEVSPGSVKNFLRVLVANRGEIAIRIFRACTEMGITTVAVYSEEDILSLHRSKADEAYLIGEGKGPVEAYLDIEGIVRLALEKEVDAVHPGYGFLAENPALAEACRKAGIFFIGPPPEVISCMGDKVEARRMAARLNIPTVPGTDQALSSDEEAVKFAETYGYPILIKAAHGGGGRGIRIAHDSRSLIENLAQARSEAKSAFGSDALFLERYISHPKHIEVQILADHYGNILHLFERDCSVQRRYQKVVEIAPAVSLSEKSKQRIYEAALALAREVHYVNAGTVEFLVDPEDNFYFLEMNTRIQVEHTVTEMITGIDLVQAQIRIAEGYRLSDPEIGLPDGARLEPRGYALQCRITTEDPTDGFRPDIGRLAEYRSPGGFGLRLDAASAFPGAVITPYYDSLLVKVTSWGLTFSQAVGKMERALQEFRVRGVKTNIAFLTSVIRHPRFRAGTCDTAFLDEHPELWDIRESRDRATRLLNFLAEATLGGTVPRPQNWKGRRPPVPRLPKIDADLAPLPEHRRVLDERGPTGLAKWVLEETPLLVTDTTFRDAHQSLLATRVRTYDLLRIAQATDQLGRGFFSFEVWGGATFDVCLRFLKECPWERLTRLRKVMPGALFQMLLRGANAVGYANYPDNVVREFIREAADAGIDIFRIFDCFNWVPNMHVALEAAGETGKVVEAAICYTGDITDPRRDKYSLKYYVDLARELTRLGAHFICIKDMAGLCKPYAAAKLVRAIKDETGLPVHFHTHATSGNGEGSILKAAEAGVDIVDMAIGAMSGFTSQPSLNAVVAALEGTERDTGLDLRRLQELSAYWEVVREYYAPFEGDIKAANADVYLNEIPGGQYTNLRAQARTIGLGDRWEELKRMYGEVNQLLGDIIKVTPSSKAVGDLALFLMQNHLSIDDLIKNGEKIDFPESVVSLMRGELGQPHGGLPSELQRVVLKGRQPIQVRPGTLLPSADFVGERMRLKQQLDHEINRRDLLSALLYPGVFEEFDRHRARYGDVSAVPTPTFMYGLEPGEEILVEIGEGKVLHVKLVAIGEPGSDGYRPLLFELNGRSRVVRMLDDSIQSAGEKQPKADRDNPAELGAPLAGKVVGLLARVGDPVEQDQPLFLLEAMKLQVHIKAPQKGVLAELLVREGATVNAGDLLARLAPISS